jgi:hypothetical protein
MKPVSTACFLAVALTLGQQVTTAQSAKFRHLVTAYADDKGVGFNLPEGVACGANGDIVVGDTGNDRLVRLTLKDKTLSAFSVIKIPEFSAPSRIQLNSKGEIYALDARQRRIVHLSAEGELKGVVTFGGAAPPSTIVPRAFAIDAADNIDVLDTFSARVLILDSQGKFQRELALPVDIGFASDVSVDGTGGLLVLDAVKRRMYTADKDAKAFALLGDLTGALATLPTYMTASRGSTFVLEGSGSSIVTFRRDGSFMSRQLSQGVADGSLNHPAQMCINDKDEAFIADRDNSRIQVFQLIR